MRPKLIFATVAAAVAAGAVAAPAGAAPSEPARAGAAPISITSHRLTPSSPALAACMPGGRIDVKVAETVDELGFDVMNIKARKLAPNRSYTVFLLEQAANPFGAAEYIGDFTTNRYGYARNQFRLIVAEAFSSTLVGTERVRKELNQMGVWFADPADDDFCPAAGNAVTPFDGDNEAGVQAFNSANTEPLPAP